MASLLELPSAKQQSIFNVQHGFIWGNLKRLGAYPHQIEAVKAVKQELEQQSEGEGILQNVSLVVLPTGTGKTGVGVLAAYACNARKVLVITPSATISKQQLTQFKFVRDSRLNPHESRPFLAKIAPAAFTENNHEDWAPTNSKVVLTTRELTDALDCELVIANAHKFGARASVDLKAIDSERFSLVIVDEAHHYPADTWVRIVRHFSNSVTRILFLTATPYNRGEYILRKKPPCYTLERPEAIVRGYIRPTKFLEVGENDPLEIPAEMTQQECYKARLQQIHTVLLCMKQVLQSHDELNGRQYKHKGLILASTTDEARLISKMWNDHIGLGSCRAFVQNVSQGVVDQFQNPEQDIRVLVVIFRLTEGFDYKNISVAAILRNVSKSSRVYFAQFVGRAVRKLHPDDPVKATVISHVVHKQGDNYRTFNEELLAEEDPEPEDPTE